jgi:hypothetical protein
MSSPSTRGLAAFARLVTTLPDTSFGQQGLDCRRILLWKSSASRLATTALSTHTPSAHLRSLSMIYFAVSSSADAH